MLAFQNGHSDASRPKEPATLRIGPELFGSPCGRTASRCVKGIRARLLPRQIQELHRVSVMAEVTYYVALLFVAAYDGLAAREATECPNAAVMRADALSRKQGYVGAVAFSR